MCLIIIKQIMKSDNYPGFLRPNLESPNNGEEHRSLSYSTLAREIDDEQEMKSQQEAAQFQQSKNNISTSNRNTNLISQPFSKVEILKVQGSQRAAFHFSPQLPTAFSENIALIPVQGSKLSLHLNSNKSSMTGNVQINNGFPEQAVSRQVQLLPKPEENIGFKPKGLGERFVNSMIMRQTANNNDSIGTIQQESVVLIESDQDDSFQHFAPASFDTTLEVQPQQLDQKSNENNIVITINQNECGPEELLEHQQINKRAQLPKLRAQTASNPHPQNTRQEHKAKNSKQIQNKSHKVEQQNDSRCKMTKSKVIVHVTAQKEVPIENQKHENSQKKICKVEVSAHMKSTYDPVNRKSEFKLANGGNLSEPGKRESKVQIKKIEEPELSNETQSEGLKYEKQQYEKAVIVSLENIQKEIAFISENTQKTQEQIPHKIQQMEEAQYRKPTTRKIEMMKNLAPEELFNGFSSVEINERHHPYESKQKNPEYSSILFQQIQNLKKKINYLEKVSSRRDTFREDFRPQAVSTDRPQAVSTDRDHSSRQKHISINYKDYNQASLPKVFQKKSHSLRKDISSESMSEDDFIQLQMLASMLKVFPKTQNSPQELVELSLQVFENFGMQVNRFTSMDVTKFKEGVQFNIKQDLTLIWYYEGQLYLGETVNKSHGFAQLQGEGFLIQPNYSCYKGSFSKDKKCGFGIYWKAKGDKYKGEWKNNHFHGKGKLINEISEYEGHFVRGLKEGNGYELFSNGDSYEGEYESDKFNGRGKYLWKNKTQYVGDFKMGFMEGEGIWKSKKDSYEGQYYKNMKHGYGIYRWENGRVYEGKFQHGHRVSKTTQSKPTIAVEKEITYDLETQNDNESELYEVKVNNQMRGGKKRFTIQSLVEAPKRRKGSKFSLLKN